MDGRGCLVLVAINVAFSLSLVPFALGRGGGFPQLLESSEVFSARGVSSKDGVGSTESIASVVVGRGGVEMASPARCSQVQYN